jgi:DNA sulfur modification protein DndC
MSVTSDLIQRGALFVINHSGGKDSQAMTSYLRSVVPHDQLVIVHAELPEVDWEGIREHIESTCEGIPVHYCRARKTFFDMVEHRQMWPSPKYRQCTSDLKRGPIEKTIRHILRQRGKYLVVNCMGLRAQESASRRKATVFKLHEKNSVAGRIWYDWLPIHAWTEDEVYAEIARSGQRPHPAYAAGMTRLSCCFCIMASKRDLKTAARLKPELFQLYIETERRLDQTMLMPADGRRLFLDEVVAA